METLLAIIIFLVFYHLIYEAILAPNMRMILRYRFFALRDKLRNKMIDGDTDLSENSYDLFETSINNSIRHISQINIVSVWRARNFYLRNPQIESKVRKEIDAIYDGNSKDLKEILSMQARYSFQTLLINSGGWLPYILPIFILMLPITWVKKRIYNPIRRQAQKITFIPEGKNADVFGQFEELQVC